MVTLKSLAESLVGKMVLGYDLAKNASPTAYDTYKEVLKEGPKTFNEASKQRDVLFHLRNQEIDIGAFEEEWIALAEAYCAAPTNQAWCQIP